MNQQNKQKRILNLTASIVVTAALILAWHFIAPLLIESSLGIAKYVSYALLLYGATWIVDAAMLLAKEPEVGTAEAKIGVLQNRCALVGMVVYLAYSALAHGAVAVLFDNGGLGLMYRGGNGSIEKCGLAFIGFCLLLQSALHNEGKRALPVASGILTFVLGSVLAAFMDARIVVAIMAAVTMILFFVDAAVSYKPLGVSPSKFILKQIGFLAILSAVMVIRHFTPILTGSRVSRTVVSTVINLAIAAVIDVILAVAFKSAGKKTDAGTPSQPAQPEPKERERELASAGK